VYANSINEIAENKNVGVMSVSSSIFLMSTVNGRQSPVRAQALRPYAFRFPLSIFRFPLFAIR
jgi:hypothetical protein